MKKYLQLVIMSMILSVLFVDTLYYAVEKVDDRSLSQIEADIEKLNKEKESLQSEVDLLGKDVQKIGQTIETTQAEIDAAQTKISQLEKDIPKAKGNAGNMLQFLQLSQNTSFVLELASGTLAETQKKVENLNVLVGEATSIINNLLVMEKELAFEKTNLEIKQEKLVVLKEEKNSQLAAKGNLIDDNAVKNKVNQDLKVLYEEAGCKPGEVFGISCGLPPEPPTRPIIPSKPVPPSVIPPTTDNNNGSTGGGGNNGGSTGGNNNGNNGGNNGGGNGGTTNDGILYRPTEIGQISEEYGGYPGHIGIDSALNRGTPIYPVLDGVVISATSGCFENDPSCGGGFGNYVVMLHNVRGTPVYAYYAHMSSVNVSRGQNVGAFTSIGSSGNTGQSTGPHLHLELIPDSNRNGSADRFPKPGESVNPRNYIKFPSPWVPWNGR
ncbi:MAG: peptidoglycan DD-metalloendopeptidase family protein [Mycoplasmatales bacterium]